MKIIPSGLISSPETITAFFTSRHGGVSKDPFNTLNLAFHVGDNREDVLNNHALLAQSIGYNHNRLVHMRQIHSDRVVTVDESFSFDTPPECDALITDRPDIPLMVMSADCTPILIHDPVSGAIGAVHAGRAGALSEILPKTITKMIEVYGSHISDIHISMGPSIHGCCYEINDTIAEDVKAKGYESSLRYEAAKVFLDVNTILKMQLKKMGISLNQTEVIESCTSCQCNTYFSYRADNQRTGRIAGVIILRS